MRAALVAPLQRLARIALAGFAATILLLVPDQTASAGEMVSVSREKVNMREGPSTRRQAMWILSRGYPLKVIGRQGDWLKVQDFEKDVGWVYKALTSGAAYHIVTVRIANLRAKPSTRSRAVGQVAYGEVVRTLEKRSDWVLVQRANKLKGWVAKRLLWGW